MKCPRHKLLYISLSSLLSPFHLLTSLLYRRHVHSGSVMRSIRLQRLIQNTLTRCSFSTFAVSGTRVLFLCTAPPRIKPAAESTDCSVQVVPCVFVCVSDPFAILILRLQNSFRHGVPMTFIKPYCLLIFLAAFFAVQHKQMCLHILTRQDMQMTLHGLFLIPSHSQIGENLIRPVQLLHCGQTGFLQSTLCFEPTSGFVHCIKFKLPVMDEGPFVPLFTIFFLLLRFAGVCFSAALLWSYRNI